MAIILWAVFLCSTPARTDCKQVNSATYDTIGECDPHAVELWRESNPLSREGIYVCEAL